MCYVSSPYDIASDSPVAILFIASDSPVAILFIASDSPAAILLQMVTSVSMQAFHGMFSMRPSEKSLPSDLNARIITVRDENLI